MGFDILNWVLKLPSSIIRSFNVFFKAIFGRNLNFINLVFKILNSTSEMRFYYIYRIMIFECKHLSLCIILWNSIMNKMIKSLFSNVSRCHPFKRHSYVTRKSCGQCLCQPFDYRVTCEMVFRASLDSHGPKAKDF